MKAVELYLNLVTGIASFKNPYIGSVSILFLDNDHNISFPGLHGFFRSSLRTSADRQRSS